MKARAAFHCARRRGTMGSGVTAYLGATNLMSKPASFSSKAM
jgi:hypothetical protein